MIEQRYLVEIPNSHHVFYRDYLTVLTEIDPVFFNNATIEAIYHESCRQVFDCLVDDFIIFESTLKHMPNFNLFLGNTYFQNNSALIQSFKKGIYELGIGIYFAVNYFPFFNNHTAIILEHIEKEVLVFTVFSEEN